MFCIFFACGELQWGFMHYIFENFHMRRAELYFIFFASVCKLALVFCKHFANLLWYFANSLWYFASCLQTCFDIFARFCKFALVFCKLFANLLWYFASILQTHFDILQAVYKLALVFCKPFANLLWYFASRLQTSSVATCPPQAKKLSGLSWNTIEKASKLSQSGGNSCHTAV